MESLNSCLAFPSLVRNRDKTLASSTSRLHIQKSSSLRKKYFTLKNQEKFFFNAPLSTHTSKKTFTQKLGFVNSFRSPKKRFFSSSDPILVESPYSGSSRLGSLPSLYKQLALLTPLRGVLQEDGEGNIILALPSTIQSLIRRLLPKQNEITGLLTVLVIAAHERESGLIPTVKEIGSSFYFTIGNLLYRDGNVESPLISIISFHLEDLRSRYGLLRKPSVEGFHIDLFQKTAKMHPENFYYRMAPTSLSA